MALLVVAEFVFDEQGEAAYLQHHDRTMQEIRAIEGCLQAVLWKRPGCRYQFSTLWSDEEALGRWVECPFHRQVLMPGFRSWCTEGSFGEYELKADHDRARRCAGCGRWTKSRPGWLEHEPSRCRACDAVLDLPMDAERVADRA